MRHTLSIIAAGLMVSITQAFSPAVGFRAMKLRPEYSSVCMQTAGHESGRRRFLKLVAAGVAGLAVQPMAPAFAVRESKEQLLTQAVVIQKELNGLLKAAELAEADWETKEKLEAQKEYYSLQTQLRGGQLSQLRGTCFHLYRDHIVDAAVYKEAEKKYKDILTSVDKLNTLLLKASRDELKIDQIKAITPAMLAFAEDLKAFVDLAQKS